MGTFDFLGLDFLFATSEVTSSFLRESSSGVHISHLSPGSS